MILATTDTFENAKTKACIMAENVLSEIEEIGLTVALEKTEVAAFWKKGGDNNPLPIPPSR